MRFWRIAGVDISNAIDQSSRQLSSCVICTQKTPPPLRRTAAARRLTAGTMSRAVGTTAWPTASFMKACCRSMTTSAVRAGSSAAKQCSLPRRWTTRRTISSGMTALLRGSMLLTAASLFACALPFGFAWFFVWRFLSGGTGGVLMALAAPSVMPGIPAERRGLAGGAIFTGVGLGIAASGTLVPFLMQWGLAETWLGLGIVSLVLTAIAWNGWPADTHMPEPQSANPATPSASPALRALYL